MSAKTNLPEEAVEALAIELSRETGDPSIKDGAGMYEKAKIDRARRLLARPAAAIRKQERERVLEAIEFEIDILRDYQEEKGGMLGKLAGEIAAAFTERLAALEDSDA